MANPESIKIGKCIYCGDSEGALSDEHAIPYGLNGDLVLREASCETCARITSLIELRCLRGLLGRARARLSLKSRRPKAVNTAFNVNDGSGWQNAQINAKDFAGINPLPWFEPPAFVMGKRIDGHLKIRGWDNLNFGSFIPDIPTNPQAAEIRYRFTIKLDEWDFARMIAKIGYCCAVAEYGLEKIGEKFVIPSILKKSNDVQTWVGSEDIAFESSPNNLHVVQVFVNSGWIWVRICLFAAYGGKPYTVVVGEFKN